MSNQINLGQPISCISGEIESDNDPGLLLQLKIQQALYTFFGTQPIKTVKDYLLFIPKGTIFFHGDNINEPEILYTKIKTIEKIYIIEENGYEIYKFKINEQKILFDSPIIKFDTQIPNTNKIVSNSISQAQALLSKASRLRLYSTLVFEADKIKKKFATETWENHKQKWNVISGNEEIFELIKKIDNMVELIYDFSEQGLLKKAKLGYDVFDLAWSELPKNKKYKFSYIDPKYITSKLIEEKKTELDEIIHEYMKKNTPHSKDVKEYYDNIKSVAELNSRPEDEFLMPPAKTQFFGNPCAETNIQLLKGSTETDITKLKTSAKYLYSMQVYMFQNDVYLLDYLKLRHIFTKFPDIFNSQMIGTYGNTGIGKRSFYWSNYFKSVADTTNVTDKKGLYTYPFEIDSNLNLTEIHTYNDDSYIKLKQNYDKVNGITENKYKYVLRNNQPKEDTPIITHLNFIFSLRGFNINLQGTSDFDAAETYIPPTVIHPRVNSLFGDSSVLGNIISNRNTPGIICREFTIYNSPSNLLYLCYASTLPNYSSINPVKYSEFFKPGLKMNTEILTKICEENNREADNNGNMFVDFSNKSLYNPNFLYSKRSINIFSNKFQLYNKSNLKILQKKYTNPNGSPGREEASKNVPQIEDLQKMLNELNVRINIYNTILYKLSLIKFTDINGIQWKLTMCSNKILEDNTINPDNIVVHGLKVIFTKEGTLLNDLSNKPDTWIYQNRQNFKNVEQIEFGNFINNINSGMVTTGYEKSRSPFLSPINYELFVSNEKEQLLINKADMTDYSYDLLSGSVFELIRYNYGCKNNWENNMSNMTQSEIQNCTKIAYNISKINDPIINRITEIEPKNYSNTEDCLKDKNRCLQRIKKLSSIYETEN
jgi:hypothetical protein